MVKEVKNYQYKAPKGMLTFLWGPAERPLPSLFVQSNLLSILVSKRTYNAGTQQCICKTAVVLQKSAEAPLSLSF